MPPLHGRKQGGFTHVACSPVRVVGADRVRGPLTHRLHPGKMQSLGSPCTFGQGDAALASCSDASPFAETLTAKIATLGGRKPLAWSWGRPLFVQSELGVKGALPAYAVKLQSSSLVGNLKCRPAWKEQPVGRPQKLRVEHPARPHTGHGHGGLGVRCADGCVMAGGSPVPPFYFVHSMPAGIKWPLLELQWFQASLLKGGLAGYHARNGIGRIAAFPESEQFLWAIQTCIGPRCP